MISKSKRPARSPSLGLLVLAVACLVTEGIAASGYAADDPTETSPRDLIYAYKVWKLTDMLDLSEEQMPQFFAKIRHMDEKEFEISEGERDAAQEIGRLLERQDVTDEELAHALRGYEDMRAKRWEELQAVRRDALAGLSVRQRCSYVVFEERFRAEMRQMIGRAREIRRGGGLEGLRNERGSGAGSGSRGLGRGGR